jgi:hypothetical protein
MADDDEKLYTKEDMREVTRRLNSSPGTTDKELERKWTDEDFIRILTRAGQVKASNMERAGREFDSDKPIVLSKSDCQDMIDEAIRSALGQIGFPIRTDEERKQTIIIINNLKKLDVNASKFWGQVLAGIGAIFIAVVGPLFVWWLSMRGGK